MSLYWLFSAISSSPLGSALALNLADPELRSGAQRIRGAAFEDGFEMTKRALQIAEQHQQRAQIEAFFRVLGWIVVHQLAQFEEGLLAAP